MYFADDIRIYQWLLTEDNNLKLNDFNRAVSASTLGIVCVYLPDQNYSQLIEL